LEAAMEYNPESFARVTYGKRHALRRKWLTFMIPLFV
jgi:hypothetical protein